MPILHSAYACDIPYLFLFLCDLFLLNILEILISINYMILMLIHFRFTIVFCPKIVQN